MTQYPELFASLAAPYHRDEVKVRAQAGRQLQYVTARTVMNRLDEVLGPEGWWDEYIPSENSVLCRLTIRLPDGSTLTKADAGGYAGMADQGDDDKSGFSDAFKRAAVKFGPSRYLYRDGVPDFTRPAFGGEQGAHAEPETPAERQQHQHQQQQPSHRPLGPTDPPRPPRGHDGQPRSGKALFAWTKDQEQRHEVGLLKYLNSWAKLQDFPGRMVDWDAEQVGRAHAEAVRKLGTHRTAEEVSDGEVYDDHPRHREPGEEG